MILESLSVCPRSLTSLLPCSCVSVILSCAYRLISPCKLIPDIVLSHDRFHIYYPVESNLPEKRNLRQYQIAMYCFSFCFWLLLFSPVVFRLLFFSDGNQVRLNRNGFRIYVCQHVLSSCLFCFNFTCCCRLQAELCICYS